jgi:hypothetical protein
MNTIAQIKLCFSWLRITPDINKFIRQLSDILGRSPSYSTWALWVVLSMPRWAGNSFPVAYIAVCRSVFVSDWITGSLRAEACFRCVGAAMVILHRVSPQQTLVRAVMVWPTAHCHTPMTAQNVPASVNTLSFSGATWMWNEVFWVPQPVPKIGLCVVAVNQKKKFYFDLVTYWHEVLFLPHVVCTNYSLGEAPAVPHTLGPRGAADCEDKTLGSSGWNHSLWLLSTASAVTPSEGDLKKWLGSILWVVSWFW